jgi:hypothetical protein
VGMIPATTAEAATTVPLTCGMVVKADATVVLKKDLHCTTSFAVRVGGVPFEDPSSPHVVIDLRGHTLSGPGSGSGIYASGGTIIWSTLEVKNGRLQGWDTAVSGDATTSVRNVVLTKNRVGFFCNQTCTVDRSSFSRNTEYGFIGYEIGATINRSTFDRNKTGA